MALTRRFLNTIGIDTEKQDEIIEQHTVTLNEIKTERDQLKTDIEKYKEDAGKLSSTEKELSDVKKELSDAKKELEELKESPSKDGFKEKYDALKAEYDTYKKDIETKAETEKKVTAYKALLKELNIPEKRFDAVVKLSTDEIAKIEFEEDGKVKDSESIKESIKENWSDYIAVSGQEGASVATPPANNGNGGNAKSRAAEIAEKYHNDLYGKTKED